MKNYLPLLGVLLSCIMLTGCASVTLKDSWRDSAAPAKQYRKLLIVGVTEKTNMREVFEAVFAGEIRKQGVTAIPSYTITGVTEKLSRAAVEDAVRKSGADGVITARLVSMKNDTQVHTGFVMTDRGYTNTSFLDPTPYPMDLYGFCGSTVSYATFEHQAVNVTMSTVASIETNLFDSGTGRMVWTGHSNAVDPKGIITASDKLAEVIIKAMSQAGLL